MRGEPDPNADPYRALGLEPGASMAEIKRAYRLLAKAFHPDSAGEAALPRFLAIHAAYEQLKTGRVTAGPRAARPPTPPAPAEPWRADPARARAARERARTARAGTGKTGSGAGGARTGATRGPASSNAAGGASGTGSGATGSGATGSGATGSSATGSGTAGSASTRGGRASTGTRGSGRRRDVRKATMGSTSYDEARDPSDATWSGASWYGPSSGEYWIVNPREYADPRKHGPEYQQRARRPADDVLEAVGMAGESLTGDRDTEAPSPEEPAARPATRPAARSASSRAPMGRREPVAAGPAAMSGAAAARVAASGWTNLGETPRRAPGPDIETEVRGWLGGPADDPVRRLGLALVAWPPIGLAAAAVIGDVTGCSVYSASCTGPEPLLPWLAQAGILGLLLLLPPVARMLAGGAVAVLLALVPITAFLVALGGTGAPEAGPTLAVLLGMAWLAGIGWAAATFRQRRAPTAGS